MDTKRIYRESRGSNYTGYNRASSRRKRSVHVKKLFVGIVYDSWTQCILWERSCECT